MIEMHPWTDGLAADVYFTEVFDDTVCVAVYLGVEKDSAGSWAWEVVDLKDRLLVGGETSSAVTAKMLAEAVGRRLVGDLRHHLLNVGRAARLGLDVDLGEGPLYSR